MPKYTPLSTIESTQGSLSTDIRRSYIENERREELQDAFKLSTLALREDARLNRLNRLPPLLRIVELLDVSSDSQDAAEDPKDSVS